MSTRVHPVWLVLIGILSVQIGAALAKSLFDEVSPTTMVWLRLAASALVFVAIAPPRLAGRSWSELRVAGGLGIALASMNWGIYQSFSRIPLGLAVTLEFVGPLALAVAGSRRARDLVWVGLAAFGVALLGFRGGDLELVGVLFALFAGVAWACYILLSAQTGRHWEGLTGLSVAAVVAVVAMTPLLLAGSPHELGSARVIAIGAAVAVLSSVVPYGCELVALRTLPPAVVSILLSLEPAAAALAGIVLLAEHLGAIQWLAIGCVIAASVGATRSGRVEAAVAPE